jgi:hypothetical protein
MRVGTPVLYTMAEGRSAGCERPAFIVANADANGAFTLHVLHAGIQDAGSELERGGFQCIVKATPDRFRVPSADE